jgi:capsular polysaccharide biosynthesis protein
LLKDTVIELSRFQQIGQIPVAPIYATYPRIYQRHLIPDDVFQVLNARWDRDRIILPPVRFFKAHQVFVTAEGLVFTNSGALVAQTRAGHSDWDVEQSRNQLELVLNRTAPLVSHKRAILCKKRGATNYGHWLVEMLPKAFWARQQPGLEEWPVVVHETTGPLQEVVRDSLEAIGVAERQILATGREPVYFEELIIVDGLTSHGIFISPLVLECIEAISAKAGSGAAESLYAVRRPAVSRDFEHEPEIARVLDDDGYQEIETGNMKFMEQVAAFKAARRVTGPTGAALTNIIFCRPGTEILIFMPASALELFFWLIAEAKKLDYHEVRCEEAGESRGALPWDRAQRISTPAVRRVLARLGNMRHAAALPLESEATWPAPFSLGAQRVSGSHWGWQLSNGASQSEQVQFKPDGAITGHNHPNERAWRISRGMLEIFSAEGKCSWRFEDVNELHGRLRLRARYRLDPNVSIMLTLTEEKNK